MGTLRFPIPIHTAKYKIRALSWSSEPARITYYIDTFVSIHARIKTLIDSLSLTLLSFVIKTTSITQRVESEYVGSCHFSRVGCGTLFRKITRIIGYRLAGVNSRLPSLHLSGHSCK